MKTHIREILIYFNPHSPADRKTVAFAQSISRHVRAYAYSQAPSSPTSWQQILQMIGVHPKELLNKAHPYYQAHIRGRDFDEESWVKIIMKNPDLLKAPIAIRGRRAIQCCSPTDILKLTDVPVVEEW